MTLQAKAKAGPNLTQKGLIFLAVPLVMQVALIGYMFQLQHQAEQDAAESSRLRKVSEQWSKVILEEYEAASALFGAIIFGAKLKVDVQTLASDIRSKIAELRDLTKGDPRWDKGLKLWTQKSEGLFHVAMHAMFLKESKANPNSPDYAQTVNKLKLALGDIGDFAISVDDTQQDLEIAVRKADRSREELLHAVIDAATVNVAFIIVAAIFFSRHIVGRLAVMIDNSHRLATNRILRRPIGGTDEIALLDQEFHAMAGSMMAASRRQRALTENARDLICSLDSRGKFLEVSGGVDNMLGYSSDDLVGRKVGELLFDSDAEHFWSKFEQLTKSMIVQPFEARVRNKDHKIIDILWSATYSEVEQSVFCVAHDITERKNAERLRQDLMQMVSHDLRTPLTTIKGMIDMFTEGLANSSSEKGKQLLGYADKSTFRMLTLINDLLDAERIESGMLELDKRDTELDGVFEQAIHTVLPLAEERRIKIAARPTSLRVFADGDRIVQVLINLLGNAIKFSGPNTTIRLETDIVDGAVEISVSDQGRGIPPERLDSVFDRFSQVEVADAKDRSGSGLGLAICKALVDLHGGRISVKSKVGEGTTFSFTIPMFSG